MQSTLRLAVIISQSAGAFKSFYGEWFPIVHLREHPNVTEQVLPFYACYGECDLADCFHAFATTGRGTPESMEILTMTKAFFEAHI